MKKSCLVPVGRVVKPHGVRGAVKIFPYGETLGQLSAGDKLISVASDGAAEREITLLGLGGQKRSYIGTFEEIRDLEQAREMAGKELLIPEDRLPALPEGEYYHFQLIGLRVETRAGEELGSIRSILETGSNDVYVVEKEGKEILIPAIEDVIVEVDLEAKKVIVDLPEGLE